VEAVGIGDAGALNPTGFATATSVAETEFSLTKMGRKPSGWLSVMPEPAATIFAVAAFSGLRRGELQGLRWEDYEDGQIRVSCAIWEGHVNDPKTGRSKAAVPLIKQVGQRLEFHRMRCGGSDTGPMFPNLSGKLLKQRAGASDSPRSETLRELRKGAD
jgi:integrase